jgi:hypothetical protein
MSTTIPPAGAKERRAKVKEIAELLRSDLFKRVGGVESAIWESPGGWKVTYTYDQEATGRQPIHVFVFDPTGKEYAQNADADVEWLDEVLP